MMQPAIAVGTVLQNRYHLLNVIGQGGFGRTYLAEDRGRFNELCAIKELIPLQGDPATLDKAKELFVREANILYQIQHSQIPQFRASFEQDQRLFLVQDYVEGKTYETLLQERLSQGQTFTEGEIVSFLQQLLPVLGYLHQQNIIHRDIAPDNIILRSSDRLPVLIDFGVVKELATRFQLSNQRTPATTVGKFGYAPSEQIQTGRAYPCSDLYSLAVTAVVLLSGKSPKELFNDLQLTWQWQDYAPVNPRLAEILNRMLSYRPGDRFQSANEVLQALQGMTQAPPHLPPTSTSQPSTSQVQTIAMGRRPDPAPANQPANPRGNSQPDPVIPNPSEQDRAWQDTIAVVAVGAVAAILAGLGSWAVVSVLRNRQAPPEPFSTPETPLVESSPTPVFTESPSPSVSPSPSPITYTQRLNLTPGLPETAEGDLTATTTLQYLFRGEQNQVLDTSLAGEGVLMTVFGPDGQPLAQGRRVLGWKGSLPDTGDYTIELRPIQGLASSNYQLTVQLNNPPVPSPSPTESASPSPTGPETINLSPESPTAQVSGVARPGQPQRYLINLQPKQVLRVEVTQGAAALDIRYPNGQLVEDAAGLVSWEGVATEAGAYQIDVVAGQQPVNFTLDVNLR